MRILLFALLIWPTLAFAQGLGAQDREALRTEALAAINADRMAEGLGQLTLSETLNEIALAHARDMAERDYFAHESPDGTDVRDRFLAAGGSEQVVVGENLANCTGCGAPDAARVRELQRGWMDSPGHRANILTAGFDRFGFAIAQDGRRQYAVQTFSGAGSDDGEAIDAAAAQQVAVAAFAEAGLNVEPDAKLREAASSEPARSNDLQTVYDKLDARNWASLSLLSARCGGCGRKPTRADVGRFIDDWREAGRLPEDMSDVGFTITADGTGGKRAIALFGRAR